MAEDTRTRRSRLGTVLLVAAPTLLVAAGLLVVLSGSDVATDAPEQSRPRPAALVEMSQAGSPSSPKAWPARSARPESVVVPALGVDAVVSAIQLEGVALTPPADPQEVGWWSQGARPGASTGSAVLTGHTVHTGGGAFDDLDELVAGDEVVVRTDRGALAYDVVSVSVLGRGELARRSADIFEQSGPPRLVLITCEDWDGTAYLSNVVVTARPVA